MVLIYELSNTRGVTLPVIVGDYSLSAVFGMYSGGDSIIFLISYIIILLSFTSILFLRKIKFILLASAALVGLTFIIWEKSPGKIIQFYLTLLQLKNLDVGTIFRTPKFFVGISYPLIFLILGINLYQSFCILRNKGLKIIVTSLLLLLIGVTIARVYELNSDQSLTFIPSEYIDIKNWLAYHQDLYRAVWLPRTGKFTPGETPVWLNTEGWGAPETSLGIRSYYYYGKPMEYLYPFIMRLLEEGKTRSVAYILSYLGVKYLILHNDYLWDYLQKWVGTAKRNLETSEYFRLAYSTEHIFVYENLLTAKPVHIATTPILIDGGLRVLAKLIESTGIDFSNFMVFFTDLQLPKDIIYSENSIVVTDSSNDLKFNILTNLLILKGMEEYILVPSYFTKGIEGGKWHPYFVDNPHHADWEVFYTWNYLNISFENSFKFYWGFIGSTNANEELAIPLNLKEGKYMILIRYFKNEKGGNIEIIINNQHIVIQTFGDENRFKWFVNNFTVSGHNNNKLVIRNIYGRNAINVILVIPSEEFDSLSKEIEDIFNKKIIILADNLNEMNSFKFEISNKVNLEKIEYSDGVYILNFSVESDDVNLGITIPEQYHSGWVICIHSNCIISSTPHFFVNNFWLNVNQSIKEIRIFFIFQKIWKVLYIVNLFIELSLFIIFSYICLVAPTILNSVSRSSIVRI